MVEGTDVGENEPFVGNAGRWEVGRIEAVVDHLHSLIVHSSEPLGPRGPNAGEN